MLCNIYIFQININQVLFIHIFHLYIFSCILLAYYRFVLGTLHSHITPQKIMFMGPTWGPPESCQPQVDPMLAPWTLLLGFIHCRRTLVTDLKDLATAWFELGQHPYRDTFQISERYDDYNTKSLGFKTSRDLAIIRLIAWWLRMCPAVTSSLLGLAYSQNDPWNKTTAVPPTFVVTFMTIFGLVSHSSNWFTHIIFEFREPFAKWLKYLLFETSGPFY